MGESAKTQRMPWISGFLLWSSFGLISAQIHVEVYKCPDSPLSLKGHNSPWRIEVPSYLFEVNLTLMQSNQKFQGCFYSDTAEMEEVSYFFTNTITPGDPLDGDTRSFLMDEVYLTPQGVLAREHVMYEKDEYCLFDYRHSIGSSTPPELTFKICPFNCSVTNPHKIRPCIKKCCPFGMVADFSEEHPQCLPSSREKVPWSGQFYDRRSWKRLTPEKEKALRPHYLHHVLGENCSQVETWFGKKVTQNGSVHTKQSVRLLSDGSLLYISGRRKWELLDGDGVDFCFDGMQNYDDAGPTSKDGHASSTGLSPWPEEEQVLIVCVSDIPLPQSKALSALYMGFLYGAAFFHCLTALVHGLLWDKQNSNGWAMFCLTGTMSIWCILMGNAHFLGLYGSSALRNAGACVANAILAHFFFLAGFTWLTLINYSIWTTFRALAPRNDGKDLTQLWYFVMIGFGGPLIVVLIGITLDQVFPDKESLVLVPEYGHNICFVADYAQGVYVYYILAALFFLIVIFFGLTCFKLYRFSQDTAKVRESSNAGDRSMALLYAKLSVVLGISWIFEFISWAVTSDAHGQSWFWSIPDLYNLITSFFIFLIYACKPSILQQLEQKYPCIKPITSSVGKVVAVAWEKVTFQSEPSSNATASTNYSQQNSSSGKNGGKSDNLALHAMDKPNYNSVK